MAIFTTLRLTVVLSTILPSATDPYFSAKMSDYLLNLTHSFRRIYPPSSAMERIMFSANFVRFSGFFSLIAAAACLFALPGLLLLCLCSLPASVWGNALRLCPPPSQRNTSSISSMAPFSKWQNPTCWSMFARRTFRNSLFLFK